MSSPGDPNPLPCGHKGERDCPPQPAVITAEHVAAFTLEQMHSYGEECYQKGRADQRIDAFQPKDEPDTV